MLNEINFEFSLFPRNKILSFLYSKLGCVKCVTWWTSLIIHDLLFACIATCVVIILEKIIEKYG